MVDLVVCETAPKQRKLDLSVVYILSLYTEFKASNFFFTKSVVKAFVPMGAPSSLTPALFHV